MEEQIPSEYDVICYGTGLVECLLAAACARIGKRVLHIDRNAYYGAQWASFSFNAMQEWIVEHSDKQSVTEYSNEEVKHVNECIHYGTRGGIQEYSNVSEYWHVKEKEPLEEEIAVDLLDGVPPENDETTENESLGVDPSEIVENTEKMDTDDISEIVDENIQKDSTENVAKKSEKLCIRRQDIKEKSRHFNLDLSPKLLFSRGMMVELLISSNVARYVEFKCITRVLTWLLENIGSTQTEAGLVVVPCSRSDVFTAGCVTLVEKRLLMKFLEFCHNYENLEGEWKDFAEKPFVDFLKHKKQTPILTHFITESIAMVPKSSLCNVGLERTKLFLSSLGRYGATPFLFCMYGSGELPQAFCRLCAVFEGTYILRRKIEEIIVNELNVCIGVLSENQHLSASHLVINSSYCPKKFFQHNSQQFISRAVLITNKSVLHNEKEQITLLRLPGDFPVTVIELCPGTGVCPKGFYCVHMVCKGLNAENVFSEAVGRLFSSNDEDSEKPKIYWSTFFNQRVVFDEDLCKDIPCNVHVCYGPSTDLDYDDAIQQARKIFGNMYPEEEFLPRAPDPQEIIFDNSGEEEGRVVGTSSSKAVEINNEEDCTSLNKESQVESINEIQKQCEESANAVCKDSTR